jgi:hypothetical protein
MSARVRSLVTRLRGGHVRPPCAHLIADVRTPLPHGRRDGDELDRWTRGVVSALRQAPEVREVFARGRGGTRRELHATLRPADGVSAASHLRSLIERHSGSMSVLPAVPRLTVYTREPGGQACRSTRS